MIFFVKYLPALDKRELTSINIKRMKYLVYKEVVYEHHFALNNRGDKYTFIMPIDDNKTTTGKHVLISDCSPVDCFLCTKELKIGDKGQYLNQAGTYRIEEIKTEEERQWVIDCNGFKVCGTVSKDALSFVDEDMLFDDYSINVITPEGLQYIENLIEEGEEWVGREFAILGPCGHFH